MSSASSLVTTAASDTSSSADSRYYSGGARRPNMETTSKLAVKHWSAPAVQSFPGQSSRRPTYDLKARGVVIAKDTPKRANQKIYCLCQVCNGKRLVSKSTFYRHLRADAESEEDDAKWECARWDDATVHERALLRKLDQQPKRLCSIPRACEHGLQVDRLP